VEVERNQCFASGVRNGWETVSNMKHSLHNDGDDNEDDDSDDKDDNGDDVKTKT